MLARTHTYARSHTRTHIFIKSKKGLTETRTRIKEKNYLYFIRLTLMYCCLPTELQRKLSKMLKVTYIIMIMYYVTPMIPFYTGFCLFPLSHAVNSNRLIFDPSEVEIHQYNHSSMRKVHLVSGQVVYVYWIDTVYVQNNLPTEFSKRTIFIILRKICLNIVIFHD